jgi:hypothetical protein
MADPFGNMDAEFVRRLQAFFAAAPPGLINPGSGYRSYEEQARLYAAYKAGVPGQARAAKPGSSKHNHGLAMDLSYNKDQRAAAVRWAHENAQRFGLYFPMDDEDWHIQPIGIDGSSHGGTGGMDEKHALKGLQSAGVDPKDELASRMSQIMQVLVGNGPNPLEMADGQGQPIQPDPMQQQFLSQMYSGGDFNGTPTKILGNTGKDVYRKYAQRIMQERYGWGPEEFAALDTLWGTKESGWDPQADNPTSTAAGIAQKLQSVHGAVEGTGEGQIDWGLNYIMGRYGSPSAALRFHESNNWY